MMPLISQLVFIQKLIHDKGDRKESQLAIDERGEKLVHKIVIIDTAKV